MERKVMIVDDDPSILITIKTILESEDIDIVTADSGQACLDTLAEGFRGVILMDIMMPHMDGWDTIRAMVDQDYLEGNVIFMLTAKDAPDSKMEGLEQYVIDYVTKPFEPEKLISTVNEYLSYLE